MVEEEFIPITIEEKQFCENLRKNLQENIGKCFLLKSDLPRKDNTLDINILYTRYLKIIGVKDKFFWRNLELQETDGNDLIFGIYQVLGVEFWQELDGETIYTSNYKLIQSYRAFGTEITEIEFNHSFEFVMEKLKALNK